MYIRFLTFALVFFCFASASYSQSQNELELNPERVKMFTPYLAARHGGFEGVEKLKNTDKYAYLKEMWYFSESFYVKRNHLAEGVELNESIIDITRFEQNRKMYDEAIVVIPGYKDVLVLKPSSSLVFKPNYN